MYKDIDKQTYWKDTLYIICDKTFAEILPYSCTCWSARSVPVYSSYRTPSEGPAMWCLSSAASSLAHCAFTWPSLSYVRTWKAMIFFILNVIVIVFQKQLTRNAKERGTSSCLRYLPLCSIAITQLFANWRRWWDKLLNIEKKKRFRRAKCIWMQAKFLFLSFSVSFLVCRCSAPRCYADVIACPCWVSPKRRSSPSNQVRRGFESTPGYSV